MMLTLEQTLADQKDLARLCADRPLETDEIFPGNAYYGCDRILKLYTGHNRPLKVVIPHGVNLDDRFVWVSEAKIPLPAILSFSPHRTRAYEKETNKVVIPSAFPFLYLIEMLKDQPKPERKGTIFFPAHSDHRVTVDMDYEGIAAGLDEFEEEYKPVTVCLYWKDFLLGRHEAFQKRGMRLVSAGHLYDPYFFWRFYHLCSIHRYATANYYSSALLYSVKAGCSFFFLESFGYSEEGDATVKRELKEARPLDTLAEITALFQKPLAAVTSRQMELVDYFMGAAYLKSPEELLQHLLKAEKWDKTMFSVRHRKGLRKFFIPTCYQRKVIHLLFILGRIRDTLKT